MTALIQEKVGSVREVTRDVRPMTANVKAFKSGLACCAAGYYKPAVAGTGARIVGRFAQTVDNTGGGAGAKNVDVHFLGERHLYLLANSVANPVTVAMRETVCYAEDDQTVGSLSAGFSIAGLVYDVTAEGVWVEIRVKA